MGHRENVYVNVKLPADGGESPNRHVPWVTAEIRLFFPPGDRDTAETALSLAVSEAWRKFEEGR